MARPIAHPEGPDPRQLYNWAVKLTQALRERFAPQDTIPEVATPTAEAAPTGAMVLWVSQNKTLPLPAGWIWCGTVYLRADYPDLFALCGTTFNVGGETGLEFRTPGPENPGPLPGVDPLDWIIKT